MSENKLQQCPTQECKTPRDIVGKTVGWVGRGDMNEFFFLNALERWGIDPKTVTFVPVPGISGDSGNGERHERQAGTVFR